MSVTPLFLLSLPRSGSTFVQRVIAAHPEVATASEPWLLLSLMSPLEERMPVRGNWHRGEVDALRDFATTLPGGLDDYRAAVRTAALDLYTRSAGPDARWFVDKTPPYSFIADAFATFPDARFLILWRHPLAVVSSIVETFCGGRWRPEDYALTLFDGLARLIDAAERHGAAAVQVRYEDLVAGGPEVWSAVLARLGMPFDPSALERFADVRLDGRLGDPTGVRRYAEVSREPLDKWRATVSTPVRRAWCRRYLRWIGRRRLAVMGYDLDAELARLEGAAAPADLGASARDALGTARSLARDAAKHRLGPAGRTPSAWRYLLSS